MNQMTATGWTYIIWGDRLTDAEDALMVATGEGDGAYRL